MVLSLNCCWLISIASLTSISDLPEAVDPATDPVNMPPVCEEKKRGGSKRREKRLYEIREAVIRERKQLQEKGGGYERTENRSGCKKPEEKRHGYTRREKRSGYYK